MSKSRTEAFTDAVIAIILTILVLELPEVHGDKFHALLEMREVFIAYVISFAMLVIYWTNHHHMFQLIDRVNAKVLWLNNIFIFLISLFPFATRWVGDYWNSRDPQLTYSVLVLVVNIVWYFLERQLMQENSNKNHVAEILGDNRKNIRTICLNAIAVIAAFILPILGITINAFVLLLWLIPDKRIEERIIEEEENQDIPIEE
jgi:uncharacterized membrane protein